MEVTLISYDAPHLKSYQVASGLLEKFPNIKMNIWALPLRKFKKRSPAFAHRPEQFVGPSMQEWALEKKVSFHKINYESEVFPEDTADYFLITGAGILKPSFLRGRKILNIHPGIIPASRGLDAFKWAICQSVPVGNTLHYIDEKIDAGEILYVQETPLYKDDSLEDFAKRHYDSEIEILINFQSYLKGVREDKYQNIRALPAKMRMPLEQEKELFSCFEEYKQKFSV